MEWQQIIIDIFERTSQELETALEGLTQSDLNQKPHPDSNSIGWLTWHLTRARDLAISDLMGVQQLWIMDEWHARFNRPPDPQDWGLGHEPEDVAAFRSPDVQTLLGYHHAVLDRSKHYVRNLSEIDLDRKIDHPKYQTVEAMLVGIINDNIQHSGQVDYVRGLLKGKGWHN